jgi:hypothetical protein
MSPMDMASPCKSSIDGGQCLMSVSGALVDEAGAPVPDVLVTVCADACFYGHSIGDGTFTTEVKQSLYTETYAVEVHGRPLRTTYFVKLPPLQGQVVQFDKPFVVPRLPASGPDVKMDKSAQTLTSGDVTLTLAAGTEVQLDVEDAIDLPVGGQLRTLKLADPAKWPFVDAARVPDVLYALSPFEVEFSQPARLSFANSAGLPANAAIDVFMQHGLVGIGVAPPAGPFDRVAGAHVSSDGTRIEMDAGEGITRLTVVALKRK